MYLILQIRESSTKKRGYYRTAKVAERLKISRGRFTIFQEYSACHTALSRDLWPAKRAKPKAKRNLLKSHQPLVFGQSSWTKKGESSRDGSSSKGLSRGKPDFRVYDNAFTKYPAEVWPIWRWATNGLARWSLWLMVPVPVACFIRVPPFGLLHGRGTMKNRKKNKISSHWPIHVRSSCISDVISRTDQTLGSEPWVVLIS